MPGAGMMMRFQCPAGRTLQSHATTPSRTSGPAWAASPFGIGSKSSPGPPPMWRSAFAKATGHKRASVRCSARWKARARRRLIPLPAWGQHQPGALEFAARDLNADGQLEISVATKIGAPDENPILNAIWIFPPKTKINLDQLIAGKMNAAAQHYVDVGGPNDQSLFAGGKLEYAIKLAPGATRELTFLVACSGGSVPAPDRMAWTLATLRQAAAAVWREWAAR